MYPQKRMRRLRQNAALRDMFQENHIAVKHLIQPIFITEGNNIEEPVPFMDGIFRFSIDRLVPYVKRLNDVGIGSIALFSKISPQKKSLLAEEAYNPDGLVQRAVQTVKQASPQTITMVDIALDLYTSHGHDGILNQAGLVDNDGTIEILCKQSLSLAASGADILGPSDMMDGRVGAIRSVLEKGNFIDTVILSYAAKFASCFYGPFRGAVGSSTTLQSADKKTYQMNPANGKEAIHEAILDLDEGADIVMVKPALPYLDVIASIKNKTQVSTACYHTSGEYSMQKLAILAGALDQSSIAEVFLSFRRAGADCILSYFAQEFAETLV